MRSISRNSKLKCGAIVLNTGMRLFDTKFMELAFAKFSLSKIKYWDFFFISLSPISRQYLFSQQHYKSQNII